MYARCANGYPQLESGDYIAVLEYRYGFGKSSGSAGSAVNMHRAL